MKPITQAMTDGRMQRYYTRRFVILSREQEERQLEDFAPFTAAAPCTTVRRHLGVCGSRERVQNRRHQVFCQRCGVAQ